MLTVGPNPNNSSMESTYFVPQAAHGFLGLDF